MTHKSGKKCEAALTPPRPHSEAMAHQISLMRSSEICEVPPPRKRAQGRYGSPRQPVPTQRFPLRPPVFQSSPPLPDGVYED